jgi:low affinity Fe/Cu permease
MFSKAASWISQVLGSSYAFMLAFAGTAIWLALGPVYDFSHGWQLFINTLTTIITFLMVFVIQNSQNRDTLAIQIKLDELIRSHKGAHGSIVNIEQLPEAELRRLHKEYEELANKIHDHLMKGETDIGIIDIKVEIKEEPKL